jgi:hypothetical protein
VKTADTHKFPLYGIFGFAIMGIGEKMHSSIAAKEVPG